MDSPHRDAKSALILRIWWLATLLLVGLGLTLGGAHVLELAPRMEYDAELYKDVTSTLYRNYGVIGGPLQVLALVGAILLAWLARTRRGFGAIVTGATFLALSIVLWAMIVEPVNARWADALHLPEPEAAEAYVELRERWEYGHVAAFVAWLLGFVFLLASAPGGTFSRARVGER